MDGFKRQESTFGIDLKGNQKELNHLDGLLHSGNHPREVCEGGLGVGMSNCNLAQFAGEALMKHSQIVLLHVVKLLGGGGRGEASYRRACCMNKVHTANSIPRDQAQRGMVFRALGSVMFKLWVP